jgi:hypothetical protein
MAGIASGPNLGALDTPQTYFESSTQQLPSNMAFPQQLPLFEADTAMEIEYDIDANFCKVHSYAWLCFELMIR